MSPEIWHENASMKTLKKWESEPFTSINKVRLDKS